MNIKEFPRKQVITLYSEDINDNFDYQNEFITGFIIASNEDELVLACIDRYGENDGFVLLRFESVYRIDYGSSYEKKIESLYYLKRQEHEVIDFHKEDGSFIEELMSWVYDKKKIIEVKFPESTVEVCGYIENLENYKIRIVDKYECKPEQGYSYIQPKYADYIWIDGRRMRDAGMVYKLREGR